MEWNLNTIITVASFAVCLILDIVATFTKNSGLKAQFKDLKENIKLIEKRYKDYLRDEPEQGTVFENVETPYVWSETQGAPVPSEFVKDTQEEMNSNKDIALQQLLQKVDHTFDDDAEPEEDYYQVLDRLSAMDRLEQLRMDIINE